jgi:Recombination endonuclease VII
LKIVEKTCVNGHSWVRTSSGGCRECAKHAKKRYIARNREIHAARVKKWQLKNKDKLRIANKAWRKKNDEKITADRRARQGLPLASRPAPEACECCGKKCSYRLHLDHDHETGKFRGWLCASCNVGLGYFGDNEAGLFKALAYLWHAQ